MTEKKIFVYKLFLSLNISDFSLFLGKNCNPPGKKVTPSFSATPSKNWDPVNPPPPFLENLVRGSTPPHPPSPPSPERGGGAHYDTA